MSPPRVLRRFNPVDIKALWRLQLECITTPWSEDALMSSLDEESTDCFEMWEGQELFGYVLGQHVLNEGHILQIATSLQHRRQGVARALIGHIVTVWETHGVDTIWLEVRESNQGAQNFYRREGFVEVSRRKNYYTGQEEDAIVYKLSR